MLDDAELEAIEARCEAASPGPWKSFVEGRDHWGGDDFIQVSDSDDEPDMYVSRATAEGLRPGSRQDLDFIAAARQDVPRLVAEIRRLRSQAGPMDHKQRVREVVDAMSQGRVAPLFEAMAEDVTWRWMGVNQWSRTFEGKRLVVDKLFGGANETLGSSSSIEVHRIHADGDCVVIEHSGRNEISDGRRYDNNYCWVFQFQDGLIQEVREYMDTQLVTETFGPDGTT